VLSPAARPWTRASWSSSSPASSLGTSTYPTCLSNSLIFFFRIKIKNVSYRIIKLLNSGILEKSRGLYFVQKPSSSPVYFFPVDFFYPLAQNAIICSPRTVPNLPNICSLFAHILPFFLSLYLLCFFFFLHIYLVFLFPFFIFLPQKCIYILFPSPPGKGGGGIFKHIVPWRGNNSKFFWGERGGLIEEATDPWTFTAFRLKRDHLRELRGAENIFSR
jgi:hypothetical protein